MEEHVKAYIAGFLDGDGSLMMQIKPRKRDSRFGYRIQATIDVRRYRQTQNLFIASGVFGGLSRV